ncbi:hypothetical protein [Streptomyces sp. NPDC096351]|uniref:hypothetical protein n=1 Tax=Streptomyces sp. NPDC096351 TaxID=3366087 RepID=UPI0038289A94
MADHLNPFQPAIDPSQEDPTGPDASACHCPADSSAYLLEIEEGHPVLTHTACGKPPPQEWGDWEDLITMDPIPVTLAWNSDCDGSAWHGEHRCECDAWAELTPTTTEQQRALAANHVATILNNADLWAEPETCDAIVTAVLKAHAAPSATQLTSEQPSDEHPMARAIRLGATTIPGTITAEIHEAASNGIPPTWPEYADADSDVWHLTSERYDGDQVMLPSACDMALMLRRDVERFFGPLTAASEEDFTCTAPAAS